MGVVGLGKIIGTYGSKSIERREFKKYRGKVYAIDAPVMIYKFCIALTGTENGGSAHLFACFFKTSSMLRYGIMPLWVFDGKPPDIKRETLMKRSAVKMNAVRELKRDGLSESEQVKYARRSFTLNGEHVDEIKYLLSLLGLPFVQAPGEAEAQCAAFDIAGRTNGVVTDDWDVVLFGCKTMLKEFSNKCRVSEIDVDGLLGELEMTREQLIDLASILGNDYCPGICNLRPIDAYLKFKSARFNMHRFIKKIKMDGKYKVPSDFMSRWRDAKDYYLHALVMDPNDVNIVWNEPQYDLIYNFMVNVKGFESGLILQKLEEFRLMYQNYSKNNRLVTLRHYAPDAKAS